MLFSSWGYERRTQAGHDAAARRIAAREQIGRISRWRIPPSPTTLSRARWRSPILGEPTPPRAEPHDTSPAFARMRDARTLGA